VTSPAGIVPRLGCATDYKVHVHYWDRALGAMRYYTELTGLTELTWERVLDDFSEARIRFKPRKGDDCCGKLKPILDSQGNVLEPGLWPWAHEISIYRDGELVWMGPVFSIDELVLPDETTDFIQITARDFVGWLDRRTIHRDIFLNDHTYDLTDIAAEVVRTAFEPDDPDVLPHLVLIPSGRLRTWTVRNLEARAGEELREIARLGLDFTSVGRTILIKGPKRDETQTVRTLQAKDFLAGVEIRVVGAEAATAGVAVGGTPEGPPGVPPENIPPKKRYFPPGGPAAAVDPFFGLIENWTKSEGVLDDGYLDFIAGQKVAEGFPPPHTLSIPADSGLSPLAPVSIHHLVPSTYFIVLISGTCRRLAQYMRLSHVRVTWSSREPENVGVTFIPANVLDDTGGEPP
jgi:hypothetical protein